jgi:hypothetical protein
MIMVLAPDRRGQARKPAANGARPAGTAGPVTTAGSDAPAEAEVETTTVGTDAGPAPAPAPANTPVPAPASAPAPAPTPAGAGLSSEERSGGAPPIER